LGLPCADGAHRGKSLRLENLKFTARPRVFDGEAPRFKAVTERETTRKAMFLVKFVMRGQKAAPACREMLSHDCCALRTGYG